MFDWELGDVFLMMCYDYILNFLQFLLFECCCGVCCVVVLDGFEGGVDLGWLVEFVEQYCFKFVSLSWMLMNFGLIQDVVVVGVYCCVFEILYLIDVCQMVGQLLIDVDVFGCDYFFVIGWKFLCGL